MANNLADIVRCMETVDATKDHLKQMLVQADFGYSSETLKLHVNFLALQRTLLLIL